MAQLENIFLCATVMGVLWTLIGLPVALRTAPRSMVWYVAPALGWAIYSVLALPIISAVGISRSIVFALTIVMSLVAVVTVWIRHSSMPIPRPSGLMASALIIAVLLAMAPAAAVIPKATIDGVTLATAIFDHSKIALIDEIIRSGVPATNPFFSEVGTPDRVAYYYLWHFSAAVVAVMTNVSGWEADAGLTWFTAFASLSVMMGIAVWISGRTTAAIIVAALAAASSFRLPLDWLIGRDAATLAIGSGTGFGGWLYQTSWAPQHTASATCVVLVCLLLPQFLERRGPFLPIVVGLVAAAGFQSSVWVGGVTFGLASAIIFVYCLCWLDAKQAPSFLAHIGIAALVAGSLCAPFLYDQFVMAGLRDSGLPIAIRPVHVLGDGIASDIRRILDLPAYWLVYLPLELPACYPAGLLGLLAVAKSGSIIQNCGRSLRSLALLLATSLVVAWLFASVVGNNNDLGWRAVLPAVLLLTAFAAAGVSIRPKAGAHAMAVVAAVGLLSGLPEGLAVIKENIFALPAKSERLFAMTPELWSRVRQQMTATERVANNPLFLADMTYWPVNISWALLANRRSCYAAADLALPFAPIPAARRAEIENQFVRVFAGDANTDDIEQLANRFTCDVVVVTPQDGAWSRDPFASTKYYTLVESRAERWRIYRRTAQVRS